MENMEEKFDVFDKHGNFLGVKTKAFCHGKNPKVFHKPVWILVVNDNGEILVQKRAKTKKINPGLYGLLGGHVMAGEKPIDACVRETFEEFGIKTKTSDFKFLGQHIEKHSWEIVQDYLLQKNLKIEKLKLQKEEVESVKWVDLKEFKRIINSKECCYLEPKYRKWAVKTIKKIIKNNNKKTQA